jgi:exosortase/archaeosortase family protein
MEQKKTFKLLLAGLAIILALLPFITTFNAVLTEIINSLGLYKAIQDTLVPWESSLIVVIARWLGIKAFVLPKEEVGAFVIQKGNEYLPADLQWNCLGWQSLVLLLVSFVVGLQGNFTRISRLECVLIGLLGTFLINILRMVFITVGIYYINSAFALLIHDYFAALTTILWLFFFWWFSYAYVLEEKSADLTSQDPAQPVG